MIMKERGALGQAKACCYSVESQQLAPRPEIGKMLSWVVSWGTLPAPRVRFILSVNQPWLPKYAFLPPLLT